MKNVAATRGQTVSFATFFLVEEIAREGNWAGREMVLNFLSRPPSAILTLSLPRRWSEFAYRKKEYGNSSAMQEKT
jgi:hypothetical protein